MLVHPAGVDVNSGVEDATGCKNAAKMRAFVDRARAALPERGGAIQGYWDDTASHR